MVSCLVEALPAGPTAFQSFWARYRSLPPSFVQIGSRVAALTQRLVQGAAVSVIATGLGALALALSSPDADVGVGVNGVEQVLVGTWEAEE
jgi:hypothetical protein